MAQTLPMSPLDCYQDALQVQGFRADPLQAAAVQLTQQLYQQLVNFDKTTDLFSRVRKRYSWKKSLISGLYLWGGVGRGKTWLVDSFYASLPIENKRRVHFHKFMLEIHAQLSTLPKTPDPMPIIAARMAKKYKVICLDEFHVNDITDAMLLAGLFEALFSANVVLVTTSNQPPDELYKNGLQRSRFLPAIDWIKQHTTVFHLDSDTDYRHLILEQEGCYHTPLNAHSEDMLLQHFIELTDHVPVLPGEITVNNRPVPVRAISGDVVWLEFDTLCNTPRAAADYVFLADNFQHILLANVYPMSDGKNDVARRFMHFVDILYDKHCCLIMSADAEPRDLYTGNDLATPFLRTESRLNEMRSKKYMADTCR
jgi:cell division protein ZapE